MYVGEAGLGQKVLMGVCLLLFCIWVIKLSSTQIGILFFENIFSIICLHFELALKQFSISSFFESGRNTISNTSTGKFSMLFLIDVFTARVENTMITMMLLC